MAIGVRKRTYHYEHASTNLGNVTIKIGDEEYLASLAIRPSTVTIINTPTTDANWTAVATGLTNVLAWKLTEESGNAFDYAFVLAPTAYMTSYGDLQRDTEISAIYVRRRSATNLAMQFEYWQA